MIKGVQDWEAKVGSLKARHGEDVGDKMKLAILISMLPKDLGDMVLHNCSMVKDMTFTSARDRVLNWCGKKCRCIISRNQWT